MFMIFPLKEKSKVKHNFNNILDGLYVFLTITALKNVAYSTEGSKTMLALSWEKNVTFLLTVDCILIFYILSVHCPTIV